MLHTQLQKDTYRIGGLALCDIFLMDNALFPWIILVPRVDGARELTDLKSSQQHLLMDEITHVSAAMQQHFQADKMNVATLGNIVPQLHIHIIARHASDSAWPNPVWGRGRKHYLQHQRDAIIHDIRNAIGL